jgi:hypothetical protein
MNDALYLVITYAIGLLTGLAIAALIGAILIRREEKTPQKKARAAKPRPAKPERHEYRPGYYSETTYTVTSAGDSVDRMIAVLDRMTEGLLNQMEARLNEPPQMETVESARPLRLDALRSMQVAAINREDYREAARIQKEINELQSNA